MSKRDNGSKKHLLKPWFRRTGHVPVPGTGACPGETLTPPRAPL